MYFMMKKCSLIIVRRHDTKQQKRDRQCTYKGNNEANSRNHCCRGKSVSNTCSEGVSVGLPSTKNACAVIYCHLWPVWLYHIFTYYIINGTTYEEKVTECKMYLFSLKICLKSFSF